MLLKKFHLKENIENTGTVSFSSPYFCAIQPERRDSSGVV